ncbi:DUF4386 domain-containing protein [uncultured Kriegella sp.]|uniref:DUF4386 domain-containing protein n=1 Tax=uncultured Kriegella sp. TaxID=1798910 RepID=UPI0030DD481F
MMFTDKRIARVAGVLYLLVIICGVFAEKYVRTIIIDGADGRHVVTNIIKNEFLFRLGFMADLLMQLTYFLLPLALFQLLKRINRFAAATMVLSVAIAVAIMCINMLNHYAPLLLLNENSMVLTETQLQHWVLFYLEMHTKGYHIAQLFFGFWLLPLGYLVFKSGLFPKIIGIFLMVGCFGYLTDFLLYFLFPESQEILVDFITAPADLGELSLCLYLLIKGIK